MPTIEYMRAKIAQCYDGIAWKDKCRRMRDNQVYAVYMNFQRTGKFDKRRNEVKQRIKKDAEYHQVTLFELGLE